MDELISKRAVIEAIEKARANVGHNLERSIGKSIIEILDEVGRDVDRLPSALSTNLAEVGTDCISRQAAIEALCAVCGKACDKSKFVYNAPQDEQVILCPEHYCLCTLPSAEPYTINPDGRLWITVDDIDKVTAVVVDEHKSKFCKQFYEDYEDAQPEIVHCGECRHYVFVDDRMDMFPIRGCSVTGFRDVDAGDFCSRAERREWTI